ncbi:MAG: PKD domain-containing protein [Candidatus Aenigmatarchaeota archaeon]
MKKTLFLIILLFLYFSGLNLGRSEDRLPEPNGFCQVENKGGWCYYSCPSNYENVGVGECSGGQVCCSPIQLLGTLNIKVTDCSTKKPIYNAKIEIIGINNYILYSGIDGKASIQLPVGSYYVSITKNGYKTEQVRIEVFEGNTGMGSCLESFEEKPKICTPGQTRNYVCLCDTQLQYERCNPEGTGWVVEIENCPSGQVCQNGGCVPSTPEPSCYVSIDRIFLERENVDPSNFCIGDRIRVRAEISVSGNVDPIVSVMYYVDNSFYEIKYVEIPVGFSKIVTFDRLIDTSVYGVRDPIVKVIASASCDPYKKEKSKSFSIVSCDAIGTLSLRIKDCYTLDNIENARIEVDSKTSYTDWDGYASFSLTSGSYIVSVSKTNYYPNVITVKVYPSQTSYYTICLDRKTCEPKYIGSPYCYGNYIRQQYIYSDCSVGWRDIEYCEYGCYEGSCLAKPTPTCRIELVDYKIFKPHITSEENLDIFIKLKMTYQNLDPNAIVNVYVEMEKDPKLTKIFTFPYSGATDERMFSFNTLSWIDGSYNVYVDASEAGSNCVLPRTLIGSVYVSRTNKKPVANAGPDQIVREGEEVTLSAAASYDPDGYITSYEWRDDKTILSNSMIFTKIFSVGTHVILLTVTDNKGEKANDTVIVRVNPLPLETNVYREKIITRNVVTTVLETCKAESLNVFRCFDTERQQLFRYSDCSVGWMNVGKCGPEKPQIQIFFEEPKRYYEKVEYITIKDKEETQAKEDVAILFYSSLLILIVIILMVACVKGNVCFKNRKEPECFKN